MKTFSRNKTNAFLSCTTCLKKIVENAINKNLQESVNTLRIFLNTCGWNGIKLEILFDDAEHVDNRREIKLRRSRDAAVGWKWQRDVEVTKRNAKNGVAIILSL